MLTKHGERKRLSELFLDTWSGCKRISFDFRFFY